MNTAEFGKELLGCVQLDEAKLSDLIIEKVILKSIHDLAIDSGNPFPIAAYEMLAPLIGPKAKEELAKLLGKVGA